jgi:hypothetical protein
MEEAKSESYIDIYPQKLKRFIEFALNSMSAMHSNQQQALS